MPGKAVTLGLSCAVRQTQETVTCGPRQTHVDLCGPQRIVTLIPA